MKSRVQFKFPTPKAWGSNSPPPGRLWWSNSLLPGTAKVSNARGGKLKLRFDRYIILSKKGGRSQNPALCVIGWIALVCGCCGFMIGFGIFPDFFYSDIRIWICCYYPEKMKKRTLWKTVSTRNISGMFMVLCTMYQYYVAKIRTRETSHKTTNLLPSLLVV